MNTKKVATDYQSRLNDLSSSYREIEEERQLLSQHRREQYKLELTHLTGAYQTLPPSKPVPLTIPSIFRRSYDENFISDYLAYILDPKKNGIGNAPLAKVLEFIFPELERWDWKSVEIIREYQIGQGRIDFLILIDEVIVVGIENKIFAPEAVEQTKYYADVLDQKFDNRGRYYILLSIDGRPATSEKFYSLSYCDLLKIFRTIPYSCINNLHKSILWEDFLTHMEVYLAMNSEDLVIPDKNKVVLYLQHREMINDLLSAFDGSKDIVFDYIASHLKQRLGNIEWEYNFNSTRDWQLVYKRNWYPKEPPLRIIWVFWYTRDILSSSNFQVSVEVQGYEKWDTQEEIDDFMELFDIRYTLLKKVYEEKGIQYRPSVKGRQILTKLGIAWKPYTLEIDFDHLENISDQIIKAVDDLAFLTEPIDETLQELIASLKHSENKKSDRVIIIQST